MPSIPSSLLLQFSRSNKSNISRRRSQTKIRPSYDTLEPRQLLAADLIITEFVASNQSSLVDGNGETPDWIEIYNNGNQSANLADYALTDDPDVLDQWAFPALTLGAGEYLVVFASGDAVPDPAGNLHTNFALSAGGEYLALSDSSQNIVSEFGLNGSDYPAQFTDTSYGVGALGATGYFFEPTPGFANGQSEPTFSTRAVNFSREAGTFQANFSLTLTTDTVGGSIVYTLNGTEPNAASTVYTSAISISNSTNVRARVITANGNIGPVFGAAYTELANELDTRTSELPIVVLDNFGGGNVTDDFTNFAFSLYEVDETTGVSSLANAPDIATPSGLHLRGASSRNFDKQQFRLELRDQLGADTDFSLAGLAAESDWVLFAPFVDKSLIRNPLVYEVGRQIGLEAPNTRFVEVYLNSGNSNSTLAESDYVGVYTIRENIKIGNNRLDITELSSADVEEPDITGGYLLRFDVGLVPGSLVFDTGDNLPLQLVDPEDYNAAQRNWITDHIAEFVSVLFGGNFADPVDGYAKYIDVDSFVDLIIVNELNRDQDGYIRSNYLYKDRGGKLTQGPLWDYNLTFGIGNSRDNRSISGWQYQENSVRDGAQWIVRLMEDPSFEWKVRDRWAEVRKTVYSDSNLNSIIDGYVAELGTAPDRNFTRWDNLNDNLPFNSPTTNTWLEQIDLIKQWTADRLDWIDRQLLDPLPPVINPDGGVVPVGSQVQITAFSTTQEQVLVGFSDSALGFVPTDNSLETGVGPLWFEPSFNASSWLAGTNGVGYDSNTGAYNGVIGTDLQSQWDANQSSVYSRFEFQVSNLSALNIQEMTLDINADDGFVAYLNGQEIARVRAPSDLNWQSNATGQINDSLVLTPGESFNVTQFENLLVEGDNVLAVRGLNFGDSSSDLLVRPKLSIEVPSGGAPVFFTTDGTDPRDPDGSVSSSALLYSQALVVTQNVQVNARTFVSGQWSALSRASFVAGTLAPQADLRISEINYNPHAPTASELSQGFVDNDDFEFLELFNSSTTGTINLSGVTLSNGVTFNFGDTNLQPGERAVVVEDVNAFMARYGNSATVLGQWSGGLDNGGEQITLIDSDMNEIMSVNYGDNDPWSNAADGHGFSLVLEDAVNTPVEELGKYYSWRASTEFGGTPGATSADRSGVVINEILAHTDLSLSDSIELYNTTGAAINVGGWYLSDEGDDLLKYQIPLGTVIGAGGYLVFDELDFNSGAAGFALNGSGGDQVYLSQASGGALIGLDDSVEFDATFNGESLGRLPNGTGRLARLASTSFGSANGDAEVGPLVISEINYHPEDPSASALAIDATLTDNDLEYIEIANPTSSSIDLTNWRLRGEADYDFVAGTSLAAGEALVVVSFDPSDTSNLFRIAAFREHYNISLGVTIVGGFSGSLSNSTGRISLQQPDMPDLLGVVPHVVVDEVVYDDLAPWGNADGSGLVLERDALSANGSLAASWIAAAPTPGVFEDDFLLGDVNQDGVVDFSDIPSFISILQAGTYLDEADINGDGVVDFSDIPFFIDLLIAQ